MSVVFGILALAGAFGSTLLALRLYGLVKKNGALQLDVQKLKAELSMAAEANAGFKSTVDRRDATIADLQTKLDRLHQLVKDKLGERAAAVLFDEEVGPR